MWFKLPQGKINIKVYLVIMGILIFCTFYWDSIFIQKFYRTHKSLLNNKPVYWRWECNSSLQLCERFSMRQNYEHGESLKTCRMKCGPNPIWPKPADVIWSNKSVTFNYNQMKIQEISATNKTVRSMIQSASDIFMEDIASRQNKVSYNNVPDVNKVLIFISIFGNSSDIRVRLNIDEIYKLMVTQKELDIQVSIRATTFFGVRHGLETLSQLIWLDEISGFLRILNSCKIVDTPAFTYRGLLLDTSHHYIPISSIKRTITAMSIAKMNSFHWYMMGPQSFPFYYDAKINQAIHGAFSNEKLYSENDIKGIVNFAAVRGIRVHIEVENPAHSEKNSNQDTFTAANNSTMCFGNRISTLKICHDFTSCTQKIPEKEFFYKTVKEIFSALDNSVGFSDVQHLGGRNVDQKCLKNSVDSTASDVYRKKGFPGVLHYFLNSFCDVLKNKSNKHRTSNIILWSEFFKNFNNPTKVLNSKIYIAQINGDSDSNEAKSLINSGYRIIISNMDKLALNRLPLWRTIYDYRPWQEYSWSQRQQVLGGEASLWSYSVDDNSMDARIWPNAAVLGEVLWSDPQTDNMDDAGLRLEAFREYLIERGIKAAVVSPKWCYLNPGMCV